MGGDDFYGAYHAQETGKKHSAELGVTVTHYENMVYVGPEEGYVQESEAKKQGKKVAKLSGTEFRRRLRGARRSRSGLPSSRWWRFSGKQATRRSAHRIEFSLCLGIERARGPVQCGSSGPAAGTCIALP